MPAEITTTPRSGGVRGDANRTAYDDTNPVGLRHIGDKLAILQKAARIIRPGGRAVGFVDVRELHLVFAWTFDDFATLPEYYCLLLDLVKADALIVEAELHRYISIDEGFDCVR